ncbi:integrase [Mycolicibacterium novocastrense]|uniref:site-specific integrase n=1 Tax=Mycolicibacterium novocastrense TaxID=59813 RepID=UPI0007465661|nr:site-specific integrase [Mycolicibacterium novocastrense]KUH69205.1 integrase [Mycolicibacterium novocastrense]KUH69875.1 integrase [Mycolicibacterium novocastrense]KUH70897.1 integrase [Mycolicibacterium novocastrense]
MASTDEPDRKRTRRAEPITRRSAKNGVVTYTFQVDIGSRPNGTRERQRFTFSTLAEARREYRKITTEVAAGTFVRRNDTTVADFLARWLDGRRDVRPNTLAGYKHSLKPVIDQLGRTGLQQLRTADIDALVTIRLNGTPVAQRDKRGRRAAEVLTYLRSKSEGAQYSEILTALGEPGIKALDRLVASGEVLRPGRGRYVAKYGDDPAQPKVPGSVSARTVVTMLVVLSSALDDAMREGLVARNVARLVKRPAVKHHEMASWTTEQAGRFREHVRDERLAACWLLTLAGLRRSEILGLRWSDIDFDAGTVSVAQGRVVVEGRGTITGDPKSKRSRRALPMPADVLAALRALRLRQAEERLALGAEYLDSGLVAVNVDGSLIRPETYSADFARHAKDAAVPVIRLHDVRHTAATMLLDVGTTPSATAKWLGHDPAITLRVYGHVYDDALAAAGDALLGRSRSIGEQ